MGSLKLYLCKRSSLSKDLDQQVRNTDKKHQNKDRQQQVQLSLEKEKNQVLAQDQMRLSSQLPTGNLQFHNELQVLYLGVIEFEASALSIARPCCYAF